MGRATLCDEANVQPHHGAEETDRTVMSGTGHRVAEEVWKWDGWRDSLT